MRHLRLPVVIKRLAKQILLLTAGLLLASAYVNSQRNFCFGLGWDVNPGPFLFFAIITAGVMCYFEVRNMAVSTALQIIAFFEAAILVEFVQVSAMTCGFMQIAFILAGETILFRNRKIGFSNILLLLTGSYIESVFIYNTHMPYQMMHFFKPGWTA
jgi:hypothetical protein